MRRKKKSIEKKVDAISSDLRRNSKVCFLIGGIAVVASLWINSFLLLLLGMFFLAGGVFQLFLSRIIDLIKDLFIEFYDRIFDTTERKKEEEK